MKRNPLIVLISTLLLLSFSGGAQRLGAQNLRKHVVAPQETVYSIANRYGVSAQEIYSNNPGSEEVIRVGQTLLVPEHAHLSTAKEGVDLTQDGLHVIQKGETLYSVARLYGLSQKQLTDMNPGLSADHFPLGAAIVIRKGTGKPNGGASVASAPSRLSQTAGSKGGAARLMKENYPVKAALLLPIGEKSPFRYIDFYRGVLLALLELKNAGISASVELLPVEGMTALNQTLEAGKVKDFNLLIGGDSEASVDRIARYAQTNGQLYVSPFVFSGDAATRYAEFYRINPNKDLLDERVAQAFCQEFATRHVLVVESAGGSHRSFVKGLTDVCAQKGIKYTRRSMQELKEGNWPDTQGAPVIVVPEASDEKTSKELFELLSGREQALPVSVRVFGYPEWQSYGSDFTKLMSSFKSTIFSTFYFDQRSPEGKQFISQYERWYNERLQATYPQYAVLGYDVARFFFRSVAGYGNQLSDVIGQLPIDGLQSNFIFTRPQQEGGFANMSLFFVTYDFGGRVIRSAIL